MLGSVNDQMRSLTFFSYQRLSLTAWHTDHYLEVMGSRMTTDVGTVIREGTLVTDKLDKLLRGAAVFGYR